MSDQGSSPPSQDQVWQWHYPTSAQDQRRRSILLVVLLGLGVASLIWAAANITSGGSGRFAAVIGVLMLGILVLGELETKRARSTIISVDRMGLLTFADTRLTSSVDLRTASPPALRRRSGNTVSHWSLEVTTPEGAWHRELANTSRYWSLAEPEARTLEAEVQYWSDWARGQQPSPLQTNDTKPTYSATPQQAGSPIVQGHPIASTSSGTAGTQTTDYQWRPPIHPNATRNRRRIRVGFGGFALLIAIFAILDQWESGPAAVVLSMLTPAIVILLGIGVDFTYRVGRRFRIEVAGGALTIHQGRKEPIQVPFHTISELTVDSGTATVNTGQTTHRTTIWNLVIQSDHHPRKSIRIPTGLGSGFNTDEAIKLESDLKQFLRR